MPRAERRVLRPTVRTLYLQFYSSMEYYWCLPRRTIPRLLCPYCETYDRAGHNYCRMCGSCNGVCARGVPVPDVLRCLSYAEGYGQFALGRERFLEIPENIRALKCSDCSTCSIECPNGVRVRGRVMHAQELFA